MLRFYCDGIVVELQKYYGPGNLLEGLILGSKTAHLIWNEAYFIDLRNDLFEHHSHGSFRYRRITAVTFELLGQTNI